MLHIQNIRKLGGRRLFGGWIIKAVGGNPNEPHYLLDIHCNGPIGNRIDGCTISLNRIGELQRHMFKPDTTAYFLNYNGERTDVCVTKDWILNPENFISQLKYIIKEYHNKK
jgi:hypothetical protein